MRGKATRYSGGDMKRRPARMLVPTLATVLGVLRYWALRLWIWISVTRNLMQGISASCIRLTHLHSCVAETEVATKEKFNKAQDCRLPTSHICSS